MKESTCKCTRRAFFRSLTAQSIALDKEGIVQEAALLLSRQGTSLESLDFCEVGVAIDADSELLREKIRMPRYSVPLSERIVFLSSSAAVRRIFGHVTMDWLDLSSPHGIICCASSRALKFKFKFKADLSK